MHEISQGDSLYGCLYLRLATVSCFSLFFLYLVLKIMEQESRTGPAQGGGLAQMGEGRWQGKWGRRVNTEQRMCTHSCKCKNDNCCNYAMNWCRGNKKEWWRGEYEI
jgi:hypothetical protein